MRNVVAATAALAAGVLGVSAAVLARSRRAARTNADLWSRATRGVAERDLTPPSTVSVNNARRPNS